MRVLIAALHRPSKPTGVCRHAANLACCLADADEVTKVTLVTGAWQAHYFKTSFSLVSDKIELLGIDIKNSSLSRNLWFLFGLPQLVSQTKPDIVHLSFPLPFSRQLFKVPVVSTIHDLYPYEFPENFGYPSVLFNRWFLKQCIDNSDGLACVSQNTCKQLEKYFSTASLHREISVVYNYVNFDGVEPKNPGDSVGIAGKPYLLCVAQHRKNKNLDLLIQSYDRLLKSGQLKDSTRLIIVGDSGPETEKLCEQIQHLSLEKQICLLSSISDSELRWLYENCELFVIPSSTEGFCLPLAEALSLSCKIVCSDIPILREIGSDQCRYFDLKSNAVDNLSQAIAQAVNHDLDHQSADDRFLKTNIARQYLALYSKVASRPHRSTGNR